ncbi:hypothetical protein [Ornithinibacillus sp. 179-J 7C1 HS]|uniref:hypothetical protein n=1 Tax=Ornithinibacillus sp. 179-J 7C1 HS TaxID=3142384 RepID=UPI0039A0CCD1
MMPFLYFPEDKSEYIPAIITLVIFMILAVLAFYFFYKHSKKQEKKFNTDYQSRLNDGFDHQKKN